MSEESEAAKIARLEREVADARAETARVRAVAGEHVEADSETRKQRDNALLLLGDALFQLQGAGVRDFRLNPPMGDGAKCELIRALEASMVLEHPLAEPSMQPSEVIKQAKLTLGIGIDTALRVMQEGANRRPTVARLRDQVRECEVEINALKAGVTELENVRARTERLVEEWKEAREEAQNLAGAHIEEGQRVCESIREQRDRALLPVLALTLCQGRR